MKVKQVIYVRRFNVAQYEHEDYTMVADLETGDNPVDVMATLRAQVADAHAGLGNAEVVETTTAPAKPKKEKKAPKAKKPEPEEEEEEVEEIDEDEMPVDAEEETEEEEESEEETEEEEEEEEEEEKPAPKAKKNFKKKPQSYDRESEAHREIFSKFLLSVFPSWKKNDDTKKKAKNISIKMSGKDFLDESGEMVKEFKDEIKKLVASKK